MMQVNEIRQKFNHIEQTIDQAAQACRMSEGVPSELKQCIQELDQQSNQARQVMQSDDESKIIECVEDLEELGDRAMRACENSQNIDDGLRDAVTQAHSELSDLKRRLH